MDPADHLGSDREQDKLIRYAGHAVMVAAVVLGVMLSRLGLIDWPAEAAQAELPVLATPDSLAESMQELPPFLDQPDRGQTINRSADVHTVMPSRPRIDVGTYVVEPGDTLFAIANRFGLKPETVLWGNFDILEDDPHSLQPGQTLSILPVDGTYYTWHEGDSLVGVADFFGVEPATIIDWPGNRLKPDTDPEQPDIEAGAKLVIPGGIRETVDWRSPRITRANPASARILGPGYCGAVVDGPVGIGFFSWPTPSTIISGYVYDSVVHPAIDIGGGVGNAIFAVDAGVVVYSGWHNGGYGNVVVIDHGNGWQSLYAHLSSVGVGCGQGVFQGDVIAGMGCTGNCSGTHLHFELMHDDFGKVNPLNYLP